MNDSLAGLFAGIYITVARQIRLGDYVKLDSGEEGIRIPFPVQTVIQEKPA